MDQAATRQDARRGLTILRSRFDHPAWTGAAVAAITALTYQFPGSTYLQSDTQIYIPILEHLRDPTLYGRDFMVANPHVSFTLYDDIALGVRALTGIDFEWILKAQQVLFRAAGVLGLIWLGLSCGLAISGAWFVAATVSLGATILGPAVLLTEYEPVPRGFTVPLLILSIAALTRGRDRLAAAAAVLGTLYHPPTAFPFWPIFLYLRPRLALASGAAAAAILSATALRTPSGQLATFFDAIPPDLEALQRFRATYNWISIWGGSWLPHYTVLAAIVFEAIRRMGRLPREVRVFGFGMTAFAIAAVPASYVLLERLKWALMPQFQPMRALLFVTFWAMFLLTVAAVRSTSWPRAAVLLAIVYLIPSNIKVPDIPPPRRAATVAVLAAAAASPVLRPAAAIAAFFAIPQFTKIANYPPLHTAELHDLARWARASTPKDALFLFPDAGRNLDPGVFRAYSLRGLYVDWKTGGQVNYFRPLALEWSRRFNLMLAKYERPDFDLYVREGVDYVVLRAANAVEGMESAYRNSGYVVYRTR